jgi:hypothetical protein
MTALLRPFSVGELLDGAFSLYRRNFTSFFAIALVPYVPLIVLWLALPLVAGSGGQPVVDSATALSMPYTLLASVLIWSALVAASMRTFQGTNVTAAEALKVGLRKLPAIMVSLIAAILVAGLGVLLLMIPGLIFSAMFVVFVPVMIFLVLIFSAIFFAVVPAIMVENHGPFDALGRSRRLSKGARIRIVGVVVLATFIAALPVMAFSFLAGVAAAVGMPGSGDVFVSVGSQALLQAGSFVLSALTTPYSAAALTLLYIDRRARTEALDLEEAAARLSNV